MFTQSHKIATDNCAPHLTPKLAPWMQQLLASSEIIKDWIDLYGSPLHIINDSEFVRNANDLLQPLKSHGLTGNLFFARKANKLPWFVTAAREAGLGVDTASLQEVQETVALGVLPERIIVTAVGKEKRLVTAAIKSGALIVIDNDDELEMVRAISQTLNKSCRIGLRFSGFQLQNRVVFSRFGFPVESFGSLMDSLSTSPQIKLELLHAHIDRYDPEERGTAAHQLIALCDAARERGHSITGIDLGGGILMRYLESSSQWETFLEELLESALENRPSFTYLDDRLGYVKAGTNVIGKPDLYPVWNAISKERFITAVLKYSERGEALYQKLSDRKLSVFFEPGRALLDNTGMTAASVTFRKRDTGGNFLIGLAMNRMNLRPFRAEFCSDPILPINGLREPFKEGAFFVGNLCSESDLIFKRRISITHLPLPEDLVCFANSAGYLAHHMEIGTHGDPLPKNILLETGDFNVKAVV
jgi:diaminopimelate decarboxylase